MLPKAPGAQRATKGIRLWLRDTPGRAPRYYIRESGFPDCGTGTDDLRQAQIILSEHIANRYRRGGGAASPSQTLIAEALALYGEHHAPHTADPRRIGYAMDALLPFWAGLNVDEINGPLCRRYIAQRNERRSRPLSAGTVRRELATLRAALNWCAREGYLTAAPVVWLPERPQRRERWLTIEEAARLLRCSAPYVRRFVLLGLYTGTRKAALLGLRYRANTSSGWVDLGSGLMHRAAPGARATKKRQIPARMPSKLLAHLRRWERDGAGTVIHLDGQPVADVRDGFARACARAGLDGVTPHTLKHTSITWAMQRGVSLTDAAGYFGTTIEELEKTYIHHHPDHQSGAVIALNRGKIN